MSLSIPAAEQLRDQQLKSFEGESETTLRVLNAIPNDKLEFKPHPKSMSMGELAWHFVTSENWFIGGILTGDFGKGAMPADVPKEQPNSIAAITAAYTKLTTTRIKDLKAAKGETLTKVVDFMGMAKLPAIQYMAWNLNHSIHHRGQLSVYLRLVNAKVPSIYGPSADENPFEKK